MNQIIDPLVRAALDYVIGRPPSATKPHYEVATVLSGMCQQNVACQMNDTLDLVIAFSAWLETDDGRASLDRINALINNPALQPFLNDDGAQYGGVNGIVALANLVITTTLSMQDPSELDNLPLSSLPEDLQPDIQAVVGDLKKMLDPNRQPNILAPMKKALEDAGEGAIAQAAIDEIVAILGSDFRGKLTPLAESCWARDPFARGSYSHALPGHSGDRAILASPVDVRLFFAGEACSRNDFSTAHGAYASGVAAADQAIAARQRRRTG